MKNTYELQTYIIVNQQEYEKLKSFSHEICSCCEFGSCYNINCENYLRSNKQLFKNYCNEFYSVPVIKRMILSEKEASEIEENIKNYEKITKI